MNRRARAGEVVLVLCACASVAWQLGRVALAPVPGECWPDNMALQDDRRFAGLSAFLPSGEVVGYVDDEPEDAERIRRYYRAQYLLAPCVLAKDDRRPFVIVNGRPGSEVRPPASDARLLCDLGNGVRLFGREEPR